jgi:hypothetical protein
MKSHVQFAAALNLAVGVLYLLTAAIIFIVMGVAGFTVMYQGDHGAAGIVGIVGVGLTCLIALLGLPSIVAGWALFAGKGWGKPLALVLSVLHLPNFPFGTALGLYTFWALTREEPVPAVPAPPLPRTA